MGRQQKVLNYKNLIVRSNYIIEASYKLSLQEQRIIYILTTKINKDDESFKPYRFTVKEVADIIGSKHKNMYAEISKHIDSLRDRDLTIIKDKSILKTKWLSSAEYFINEGTIELEFSPKLKPYLLQLKERFTKLDLKRVVSFSSNYSCRVYELLKQYENIGERTLKIEELRTMFSIDPDEYKLYGDFKRKVILKAQKEINSKSDIFFDYEEIKTGKKVTDIKFIIKHSEIIDEIASETVITDKRNSKRKKKEQVDPLADVIVKIKEIIKETTGTEVSDRTAKIFYNKAVKHKEYGNKPLELIKEVTEYSRTQNITRGFTAWCTGTIEHYIRPAKQNKVETKGTFNNFKGREYTSKQLEEIQLKLLGWDKIKEA